MEATIILAAKVVSKHQRAIAISMKEEPVLNEIQIIQRATKVKPTELYEVQS